MAIFELATLSWHSVDLTPEQRGTRGVPGDSAESVDGRVSLGEPSAIALTAEDVGDDRDLGLFLANEAGSHVYHLVRLACTFRPDSGEPFVQAELRVRLGRDDDLPSPLPIAWSMTPRRAEDTVEYSTALKLVGKATLAGFVDVSVGPEVSKKTVRRQIQLVALNEMQSNPTWELRKTESTDIDGAYLFALVVRSPAGVAPSASLELAASIQRARLGGRFFRYRAVLPEALRRKFVL